MNEPRKGCRFSFRDNGTDAEHTPYYNDVRFVAGNVREVRFTCQGKSAASGQIRRMTRSAARRGLLALVAIDAARHGGHFRGQCDHVHFRNVAMTLFAEKVRAGMRSVTPVYKSRQNVNPGPRNRLLRSSVLRQFLYGRTVLCDTFVAGHARLC